MVLVLIILCPFVAAGEDGFAELAGAAAGAALGATGVVDTVLVLVGAGVTGSAGEGGALCSHTAITTIIPITIISPITAFVFIYIV
jgi:hypothetical protein